MAKLKSKRRSNGDNPPQNDIELLKADVASFASSLGLSSSSSGFNDTDFRKSGPLKPPKKPAPDSPRNNVATARKESIRSKHSKPNSELKPKVVSLDESKSWKIEKFKDLPKLPLMKASSLGVWHQDAVELEFKVLGEGKERMKFGEVTQRGVEEWQGVVEKKREVAERLMAQYMQDYEVGRGQSGDVKMLIATQRSGTAADKVSAFSVLVGDNPVANLRSLDALLGNIAFFILFYFFIF